MTTAIFVGAEEIPPSGSGKEGLILNPTPAPTGPAGSGRFGFFTFSSSGLQLGLTEGELYLKNINTTVKYWPRET